MPFKLVISKTQWILLFACTSMFALGLGDNARGPLFPDLIHFFHLSNAQASATFAISSTFGFIGNLFSERLLKHFQVTQLLTWTLFFQAFGLFGMASVPQFYMYMMSAALFGLSMGLLGVAQNLLVAENISGPQQTKALSGLHALYGFSSLVAPLIASFIAVALGNWRSGYFVMSAVSVLVFAATFLIQPSQPIPHHHHPEEALSKGRPNWFSLFVVGGIFSFYAMAEIMVSSRVALYMREYFHMDLKESSLYVTYFFTFLLIGRTASTFKKIDMSLRKQLNILLALSLISLLLGMGLHPFFLAFTGLFMAPYYPLSLAYVSEETGVHQRKYITFGLGLQNLCLITMHIAVGYLTDAFGLIYAFGVGVISLLLALLCVNFHPRHHSNG